MGQIHVMCVVLHVERHMRIHISHGGDCSVKVMPMQWAPSYWQVNQMQLLIGPFVAFTDVFLVTGCTLNGHKLHLVLVVVHGPHPM